MKYRYLIERNADTADTAYFCGTVNDEGNPEGTVGGFDEVEDAMRAAESSHATDGHDDPITWKKPPQGWQPDAILVSQFFDDGVEPNL